MDVSFFTVAVTSYNDTTTSTSTATTSSSHTTKSGNKNDLILNGMYFKF